MEERDTSVPNAFQATTVGLLASLQLIWRYEDRREDHTHGCFQQFGSGTFAATSSHILSVRYFAAHSMSVLPSTASIANPLVIGLFVSIERSLYCADRFDF